MGSTGRECPTTSIVQQSSTVNGKITDANGEPIIGASVVIKGTTNGTITDFDGNFMLEVPAKATFSCILCGI